MCEVAERLINKGRKEGKIEGENLLASLINKLMSIGRSSEITKVINDKDYRDKLYGEFGLE